MMQYTTKVTTRLDFQAAVAAIRSALSEEGFGIVTEIDLEATFRSKLGDHDADRMGPYTILGACQPRLAEHAIAADPSIGALLPCNVVIRRPAGTGTTIIESIDPDVMMRLTGSTEIAEVAAHARAGLARALEVLANA